MLKNNMYLNVIEGYTRCHWSLIGLNLERKLLLLTINFIQAGN